ncbi:MAG TPA: class I SAM-dependent methyltransferase [Terriglobia bacterium]|nr:class I SAM-dependent methyltransferase [Terriglobia bacterium]
MKFTDQIMENTHAYRLWQAPFVAQKLAPVLAHNDLARVQRVLDVGCGPGINTRYFDGSDYLGVDWNPEYIEYARHRYKRNFVVADITRYTVSPGERFDFILVNSFLHHIETPDALRILSHLKALLTDDGNVHLVDMLLPERPSVARFLARRDRGKFVRTIDEWLNIVERTFEPVKVERYDLKSCGMALWNMIYFKGRSRK